MNANLKRTTTIATTPSIDKIVRIEYSNGIVCHFHLQQHENVVVVVVVNFLTYVWMFVHGIYMLADFKLVWFYGCEVFNFFYSLNKTHTHTRITKHTINVWVWSCNIWTNCRQIYKKRTYIYIVEKKNVQHRWHIPKWEGGEKKKQ